MDEELERLAWIFLEDDKPVVGKVIKSYPDSSEIGLFLEMSFAKFRMLIVKRQDKDKLKLTDDLKEFCAYKGLKCQVIDAFDITDPQTILGTIRVDQGKGTFRREKPGYWPVDGENTMLIVDNLSSSTDTEILKALLCVSRRDSNLEAFEDSLPIGSGFVFLEDDDFPFTKLNEISEIFREEKKVFQY